MSAPEDTLLACADGVDNDLDGLADCADAEGCGPFCPEADTRTCSDGQNNDLDSDGAADQFQVSCWGTDAVRVGTVRSTEPLVTDYATPLAMTRTASGGLCALVALSDSDLREREYVPERDYAWPSVASARTASMSALRIADPRPAVPPPVSSTRLPDSLMHAEAAAMTLDKRGVIVAAVRVRNPGDRPRLMGLTTPDCADWTVHPLRELREPFASGFPLALYPEPESDRLRIAVSLGSQGRPYVRPTGGRGAVSSVIHDRLYRGVAAASTPLDFFALEVEDPLDLQSEPFPHLETLAVVELTPNPANFPVPVRQYLPGLGLTAFVVDVPDGIAIDWSTLGTVEADADQGVAERVGPILGPSEDEGRFDSGAVRAGKVVLGRDGDRLTGWLIYRGFAEVRFEDGFMVHREGRVGLAHLEVTPR